MDREYLLVIGVALGLLTLAAVLPASAGDNPTIFYTEADRYDAQPGETVDVDVLVSSDGGFDPDGNTIGITGITLVAEYDTDSLDAVAVDAGSWLETDDDDVSINDKTIIEDGAVVVGQWHEPPGDGVVPDRNFDWFATITFEIAEDPTVEEMTLEPDELTAETQYEPTVSFAQNPVIEIETTDDSAESDVVGSPLVPAVFAGIAGLFVVLLAFAVRMR